VIISFGDDAAADLNHGRHTSRRRRFPHDIISRALRKLDMLNSAYELIDLRAPPGNRLEALKGDWAGFHSIRVNEQWCIIFRWEENNAHDVRLIDYH
jgi:proteic killer suppression protein